MATCSIFHFNKSIPREDRSLILIANDIKSGVYKEPIERIRALIREGKTEEADNLKFKLKSFSPSATFTDRRKPEFLKMCSYYAHLDFTIAEFINPEETCQYLRLNQPTLRKHTKAGICTAISVGNRKMQHRRNEIEKAIQATY